MASNTTVSSPALDGISHTIDGLFNVLVELEKKFLNVSEPKSQSDNKKEHPKEIIDKNLSMKHTRRKPRKRDKKKSLDSKNAPEEIQEIESKDKVYSFTIKAIKSQSYGVAIRQRSSKCKHINLQCFYKNKVPYICNSEYSRIGHKFNQLNLHSNIKNGSAKTLRKNKGIMSVNSKSEGIINNFPAGTSSKKKLTKKEKNNSKKIHKENNDDTFSDYLSIEEVNKGLASGELIKGFIRINPKNYKEAYVNNINSGIQDYIIPSVLDRNRALEGDEVVLELIDKDKKKAKVVHILEKVHSRTAVGKLSLPESDKSKNKFINFVSRDHRFPVLLIQADKLSIKFKNCEGHLFLAKLTNWTHVKRGFGSILKYIGPNDSLEASTKAILCENNLDVTPYPEEFNQYIRKLNGIPPEEVGYREDFRKECVFTIDPLTAKDLDDAVSCKELLNGNYEVGVHISDASFYLLENTPLDKKVSKRATTVYLVETAYHMLPQEMCMNCSLLPGEDKLSFSVIWEITKDAEIVNTRFTRSIINSCTQLAYEHAQSMIDDSEKTLEINKVPVIYNGYTYKDISKIVNILQSLAVKIRQRRLDNGALKIDQVKLSFALDPCGFPVSYRVQESKEAHRLIEEFMLLANGCVAKKICESFPQLAFLRKHEAPKVTMMVELQTALESVGLYIDISSSKGISSSLMKYSTNDNLGQVMQAVLNHLLAKPMMRAKYFCSGSSEVTDYSHFALSIPIYTHFTSPIRRYADIMVHRLLAASLGYCESPNWDPIEVENIAKVCNIQKYNAKKAGDASSELYLMHYIKKHDPFIEDAAVIAVFEQSFDVIVIKTGTVVRIYSNQFGENVKHTSEMVPLKKDTTPNENDKKLWKMSINFPKTEQYKATTLMIEIFTVIKVQLLKVDHLNKLEAILLRPV